MEAFTDDSIAIISPTPGAVVLWRRAVERDGYHVASGPILAGDGWIEAVAVGPEGDTSEVVACALSILTDQEPPKFLPTFDVSDFLPDSARILPPTPSAKIHYTLDGSLPTLASPVFGGGIPLSKTNLTRIRAIAAIPGGHPSKSVAKGFMPLLVPWNGTVAFGSLLDVRDGQSYPTVAMGRQTWMAKNLNFAPRARFLDAINGGYYDWAEVSATGADALCPTGWHIPDTSDWLRLRASLLEGSGVPSSSIGQELKAPASWNDSTATDRYGFRALAKGAHPPGAVEFWTRDRTSTDSGIVLRITVSGELALAPVPIRTCTGDPNLTNPALCMIQNERIKPATVRCLQDSP